MVSFGVGPTDEVLALDTTERDDVGCGVTGLVIARAVVARVVELGPGAEELTDPLVGLTGSAVGADSLDADKWVALSA